MSGRVALNISLTPELAGFVRQQVATGRYGSVSEVVRAALREFVAQEERLAAGAPKSGER